MTNCVVHKGHKPQARIVPPGNNSEREIAPLRHLGLPDDLFDHEDAEQAAIDAGDRSDELGVWRGPPPSP